MGQTHVRKHIPHLLERIGNGELKQTSIISQRMPLAEAARGYEVFDKKLEDCRKVVPTP